MPGVQSTKVSRMALVMRQEIIQFYQKKEDIMQGPKPMGGGGGQHGLEIHSEKREGNASMLEVYENPGSIGMGYVYHF